MQKIGETDPHTRSEPPQRLPESSLARQVESHGSWLNTLSHTVTGWLLLFAPIRKGSWGTKLIKQMAEQLQDYGISEQQLTLLAQKTSSGIKELHAFLKDHNPSHINEIKKALYAAPAESPFAKEANENLATILGEALQNKEQT